MPNADYERHFGYAETLPLAAYTFGSGDTFRTWKGPKGKTGTLIDYGFGNPTVLFTAVTTPATIAIGISADRDAYGEEFSAGTLDVSLGLLSVRTLYNTPGTIDDYILNNGHMPKDTIIYITLIAPTGGSPAGTATPYVRLAWAV